MNFNNLFNHKNNILLNYKMMYNFILNKLGLNVKKEFKRKHQ